MAARSYEAGFRKYYGDRLTNISDDTSDEEIRQVYDHWARDYDKVIKMYQIISPQTILDQQGVFHHPPKPQLPFRRWLIKFDVINFLKN